MLEMYWRVIIAVTNYLGNKGQENTEISFVTYQISTLVHTQTHVSTHFRVKALRGTTTAREE